ncbi:MAG: helix-turn-helix domain-containing protein, partial [Acidobacteria bacterium]|nr:helix-turn-helix domain-containing protein [Acidobacteriota bacterium]
MGSFGENLRREREMRGVDLREIADATRINLRFLEAVENEKFGALPGGVFNRGFIRSYARYLGLDEEKILGEYELANGSEVTPEWSST